MGLNTFIYDNKSQIQGNKAEKSFVNACIKKGWKEPEHSKEEEDIYEHWDFRMFNGCKVEIKATKKLKRNNKEVNCDIIYIEFRGVTGYNGWLYGKADSVAFEREFDFVIVSRSKLARLCEKLISPEFSESPELYKSYRRASRPQERTGLIKIEDLKELKPIILQK